MAKYRDLQIVWPKDGEKGRTKRGFFSGLSDIMTGKGPDMFLQRKGRTEAIAPDRWGNWDSYHLQLADYYENIAPNSRLFGRRGQLRYDPYSREYVQWGHPHDWSNQGVNQNGPFSVPRYTEEERQKMMPRVRRGKYPDPFKMGSDWSNIGPKRWRPEHDWFWSNAHRLGANSWTGDPLTSPPWMHRWGQVSRSELYKYTDDDL